MLPTAPCTASQESTCLSLHCVWLCGGVSGRLEDAMGAVEGKAHQEGAPLAITVSQRR